MALGLGFRMKMKLGLIFIMLGQALGCMKDSDKKIVYGPEVPLDTVVSSLKNAIGPTDSPEQIAKNEFVAYETTRQIRGLPEISLLSQTAITVVDKKVTTNQWQINNTEELQFYDINDPSKKLPKIIREDHQCWKKSSKELSDCEIDVAKNNFKKALNEAASQSRQYKEWANDLTNSSRFFNFSFEDQIYPYKQMASKKCLFANSDNPNAPTCSYHQVSSQKYKIDPPRAVKNSSNCRNIPNCQIDVTVVEFDEVNWDADPVDGYKVHYKFVISPDVPQLSRRLQICKQGSVQVKIPDKPIEEAPRFLVTFCDTVVDFIPGTL